MTDRFVGEAVLGEADIVAGSLGCEARCRRSTISPHGRHVSICARCAQLDNKLSRAMRDARETPSSGDLDLVLFENDWVELPRAELAQYLRGTVVPYVTTSGYRSRFNALLKPGGTTAPRWASILLDLGSKMRSADARRFNGGRFLDWPAALTLAQQDKEWRAALLSVAALADDPGEVYMWVWKGHPELVRDKKKPF